MSNSEIAEATSKDFTATENGNYAVVVTENDCSETSSCFTVSTLGIDNKLSTKVSIYPNPSTGRVNIELESHSNGTPRQKTT